MVNTKSDASIIISRYGLSIAIAQLKILLQIFYQLIIWNSFWDHNYVKAENPV